MDQLTFLRQNVTVVLEDLADWYNQTPANTVKTYPIFDKERDHYLLLDVGREQHKRIRSIVVYIRIANNKVWIEEDWTDDGVADDLVDAGVSKSNIVLGFKPLELRPFTEFAVA